MSHSAVLDADQGVLPRRLKALSLAFIFIAFNAPLAVLAGFLQPVIAFGNGIGAPVAFLVAAAVLLFFQVGTLAMSRHMKSPGSFYCYVTEGIGKPAGLAGAVLATLAYLLFAVGGFVFFGLVTVSMLEQLFGTSIFPWQVWGFVGIAVVTLLNLLRIDLSARFVAICVALEILVVAVYEAVVLFRGGPEGYSPASFSPGEFFSGSTGLAVLFAFTTLIGIEAMAAFREEVKDPERTVPRASYAAIAFSGLFFALAAWSYIVALGPSNAPEAARTDPVGSVLGTFESYLGGFLPSLVAVLLVTSQLAASNAVQGAGIRYLYALGHDQVFPRFLGRVHPRLSSPWIAVLASVTLTLVIYIGLLVASDDVVLIYGALGGIGTLCLLPLLVGTCVAVILFFRRNPGLEGAWKALIAPVIALLGLGTVWITALLNIDVLLLNRFVGLVFGLALIGIIALSVGWAVWLRGNKPEIYARIGRQGDHLL